MNYEEPELVETCRVISGFGNNLYQIAATYGIARQSNRKYEVIAPKTSGAFQEVRDFGGHYTPLIKGLPTNVREIFPKVNWVDYKKTESKLLYSYIFDINFFERYMDELVEILKPDERITKYVLEKYPEFDLGIHLRYRGGSDSFSPEAINNEWLLDIIEKESGGIKSVVVVSNVISHAVEMVDSWREKFPTLTFTLISSEPVFVDFFILAGCRRVVCSNSTFSFWTGFLGRKKEKVYMTPEYKPGGCLTAIPKSWETNSKVFYKYNTTYELNTSQAVQYKF